MSGVKIKLPETAFDPTQKPKGLLRLKLAFYNSLRAFRWLLHNESAFRQEILLFFMAVGALTLWQIPLIQKGMLLACVLFVMFAEIINTAIEATIDRVGTDIHPLSGLAKDLGSAGVCLAMAIAAVMWLSVLFTYLLI